jgi:hypothetical protein
MHVIGSSLAAALRAETVRLEGPAALTRGFGSWFAWSPFAEAVRTAQRPAPEGSRDAVAR